jgi:hypothetical protein
MIGLLFPNVKPGFKAAILRGLVAIAPAATLILLSVLLPREVTEPFNAFFWVLSNLILGYSAGVLVVFLIAYFYFFDPRATTGGRLIFQFMLSLVGVISLNVIGIFINPTNGGEWFLYPIGVEPWRPTVRFIIYGFVAYAVTSLAILLVLRKWFPHRVRKASDLDLVKPRHTGEIPIVRKPPTVGPRGRAGDSGASRT